MWLTYGVGIVALSSVCMLALLVVLILKYIQSIRREKAKGNITLQYDAYSVPIVTDHRYGYDIKPPPSSNNELGKIAPREFKKFDTIVTVCRLDTDV